MHGIFLAFKEKLNELFKEKLNELHNWMNEKTEDQDDEMRK